MSDNEWPIRQKVEPMNQDYFIPKDRRANILRELQAERVRQNDQWGGLSHDLTHRPNDWIALAVRHLGKAQEAIERRERLAWRKSMVQTATLIVAAIETEDSRYG